METALFISENFVRVLAALLAAMAGVYVFRVVWSVSGRYLASHPDYDKHAVELLASYRRQQEMKEGNVDIELDANRS